MSCTHDNAKPLLGWHGCYRCPDCGAICYKRNAMIPQTVKGGLVRQGPTLTAYVCQVKGCKGYAVTKESSKSGLCRAWRCVAHRSKKDKSDVVRDTHT